MESHVVGWPNLLMKKKIVNYVKISIACVFVNDSRLFSLTLICFRSNVGHNRQKCGLSLTWASSSAVNDDRDEAAFVGVSPQERLSQV